MLAPLVLDDLLRQHQVCLLLIGVIGLVLASWRWREIYWAVLCRLLKRSLLAHSAIGTRLVAADLGRLGHLPLVGSPCRHLLADGRRAAVRRRIVFRGISASWAWRVSWRLPSWALLDNLSCMPIRAIIVPIYLSPLGTVISVCCHQRGGR
jgi:hypothetical protein